jgi:hypothetical protein
MKTLTEQIKIIEAAKKVKTDAIAAMKREISESKAASKKLEKILDGSRIKETRRAVEGILRQYGIDRGAHHGGNLVGGVCCPLLARARSPSHAYTLVTHLYTHTYVCASQERTTLPRQLKHYIYI